jgi:peroxiredoxin
MIRIRLIIALVTVVLSLCIGQYSLAQDILPIGSSLTMKDHTMENVTGRNLSLSDLGKENGLVVIFTSNTCPWVHRWQDQLLSLSDYADKNEIGLVAINPNERYRNRGDGMDEMIKFADKAEFDFPYLLDENHIIADAFGASRTPELFLFNSNLELVYTGTIQQIEEQTTDYNSHIYSAIESMLTGSNTQNTATESVGCTIKRSS